MELLMPDIFDTVANEAKAAPAAGQTAGQPAQPSQPAPGQAQPQPQPQSQPQPYKAGRPDGDVFDHVAAGAYDENNSEAPSAEQQANDARTGAFQSVLG